MSLPAAMDPTTIPLMRNPSGAPPDFDNGPSLLNAELGTGVALIVVGGICVTLRVLTNLKVARKLCLDDYLCLFAFAGGVGYWALNLCLSQKGAVRHAWDVRYSIVTTTFIKMQVSILFIITPTKWASKAAILALYIRVFGSITWIRRTSYIWIIFMALFYSMNFIVAGVYCIPRKGEIWGGSSFLRCSTSAWLHLVVGVFSLHITKVKKITLGLVFGVGIILVGLSLLSLYYRVIIFKGGESTWNGTALAIVTLAEIFGTIAVSCAPAMSSFWFKIFTKSTLWSEIRSSFFLNRSTKNSLQEEKPSFVNSLPQAHIAQVQNHKHVQGSDGFIMREMTFEVSDNRSSSSKKSSRSGDHV